MIPRAGWWGFGPGTFETAFPYFTHEFGDELRGRWIYAHQDYLQTLAEWGYMGFGGWAMLIGGALFYSWRQRIRTGPGLPDSARTTQFGLTIALAGVLIHALIDFPLQIASIQLYTVTLISILWSSKHWMSDTRRMQLRRMPRCQTKVLAIAS